MTPLLAELPRACESPDRYWWQISLGRAGWSDENVLSPDHPRSARHPVAPFRLANGGFRGHVSSLLLLALPQHLSSSRPRPCDTRISGWSRCLIGALALGKLIVGNCLKLAVDVNAIESSNIGTDDSLLDLICEIHSIFLFQVV